MNFEDYETLPTNNTFSHMMAGAMAGIMEHCVMYPIDSVKTRMQSLTVAERYGIRDVLYRMVSQEGLLRPIRGVQVVFMGAGPAHAMYFSFYEYYKEYLTTHFNFNSHIAHGLSGCLATLLHDGIMTPSDAIKQRLQMYNSPYKTVLGAMSSMYRLEGMKAFYRAYTTQLTMNVPYQGIHFMVYEFAQSATNPEGQYNPAAHMVSGAAAGGVAAAITTPLDVCKTLLNTQSEGKARVNGLLNAIRMVYSLGGLPGFFKGMSARVLYQMPSTAICWSTYEFFKYFLITRGNEEETLKSRDLPVLAGTLGALAFTTTDSKLLEVTRS